MDNKLSSKFPIRANNPTVFPRIHKTITTKQDLIHCKLYLNPDLVLKNDPISVEEYFGNFHKNPGKYDLHEINFQNFALKYISGLSVQSLRDMSLSNNHAYKRIFRAAIYAVSSRDDLGWDFRTLETDEKDKKNRELEELVLSVVLYDWESHHFEFPPNKPIFQVQIVVTTKDTQTAVELANCNFTGRKIAWLNMANGHSTLGAYNVSYGGSQEEEVATNTTVAYAMGFHANVINDMKSYITGENHIVYRNGHHIPPGGNYFAKTKFITSEPQVDCYMIGAAFADFRYHVPFVTSWSEYSYYYTILGSVWDLDALEERLMIDMVGVLKSAIENNITILILSASGCGAFRHCPRLEAMLWKKVLKIWGHYFEYIEFAILPDEKNPDNVNAFMDTFS